MQQSPDSYLNPMHWQGRLSRLLSSWWYLIHLGAVTLVLALTPSTFRRANRMATARLIYINTWQVLPWFSVRW